MPEENNEDIDRMSYVELVDYHFEVSNKLMDSILTKEQREELLEKRHFLDVELRERSGELRELIKRGITDEQRQQTIEIIEYILKSVKGLSSGMRKTANAILDHLKRELEKRKTPKRSCPHCGKHISLKDRFCSRCGNKIENKN